MEANSDRAPVYFQLLKPRNLWKLSTIIIIILVAIIAIIIIVTLF